MASGQVASGYEMSNNQGERMFYVLGHGEQKPPSVVVAM